jgi:pyruvate dehydrogenase E1 component
MVSRRNEISSQDIELQEWLESMDSLLRAEGPDRAQAIFRAVRDFLVDENVIIRDATLNTPYRNSVPLDQQPAYPGNIEIEQRIENILRWNAMAMVLRGYDSGTGVGGHIGTYASAATMMEVGLNHFFRKKSADYGGDLVSIQAHSAPGVYARAFLEGRLSVGQLENYRRELQAGGGLSSYPHPRNMPEFWQMPSASMGLSTPTAIYQARFTKYLERRGLKPDNGGKVWLFIGDGESDEPEVLGTINIAAREKLDNLIMVVNCNLQRLDGPRQRENHPGTRTQLPRRRLECAESHLEWRMGQAVRDRPRRRTAGPHGKGRRRRLPDVLGIERRGSSRTLGRR